jgi:hypothetical protein
MAVHNNSSRRNLKRRGVIDVQFNWIFIMIAGFVILLFIISIVMNQKKNADTQSSISTVNQINTIIKGRQQAAGVYSELSIPETTMTFQCDPEADNLFTFKISDSSRTPLPLDIIFAPQAMTANRMQMWSQSFDLPFAVTAFTYITSNDRIILIYNESASSDARALYDSLPDNITRYFVSTQTELDRYDSYGDRKKVVCFNNECPHGDYLDIIPDSSVGHDLFGFGTVKFFRNRQVSTDIPYITKASLLGAVFSDDADYYKCQMNRALDQFEIKISLVDERLRLFSDDLPEGACNDTVHSARVNTVASLNNIELTQDTTKGIPLLYKKSAEIEQINTDLKLGSCPKIY